MTPPTSTGGPTLDESAIEAPGGAQPAFDRELILFLNELRVALPGVQILFAFMLGVPFSTHFGSATKLQKTVYFLGFVCCAAASMFYIAPSVYHRLHLRDQVKNQVQMLRSFNQMAVAGSLFLAAAMSCVVFIVTDFLFGIVASSCFSIAIALCFCWFWFGLPSTRRNRERRRP